MTKLKELREATGLSQSRFAAKTGINFRTLQHYEQGTKVFDHARIDTLLRVCLALGCNLEDVLENEEYLDLMNQYNEKKRC